MSSSFRPYLTVLSFIVAFSATALFGASDDYTFSRYAGLPGAAGFMDGMTNSSRFQLPSGLAMDAAGNIFVADSGNHIIRRITPQGVTSTVAGAAGADGVADGTANVARFRSPGGVVVDASGNLFVTDTGNHVIRRISADGNVTTLAGTAGQAGAVDGVGAAARFSTPTTLALDSTGNLYVADSSNHTVRKITASGVVSTLAGSAGAAGAVDATGAGARFRSPHGVAVDAAGNVYVTDAGNHTVRKITSAGVVSTLAGTAAAAGATNGSGAAARFNAPRGIALETNGNVIVVDSGNTLIRRISAAGTVTTVAGLVDTVRAQDGASNVARFQVPEGVVIDSVGNIFVSDYYGHTVRKITVSGFVSTFAGSTGQLGANEGVGNAALFDGPYGIAIDAARNLYVTDTYNHTIRKITATGVVTTLAGSAGISGSANGNGSAARFYYPIGLAADAAGNIYVADTGNYLIRKITPDGVVTTFAGAPGSLGAIDGVGTVARFFNPYGIAADAAGNLYVADTGNHTVRKITPAGVVSTLAGTAGVIGAVDGLGSAARFQSPFGIIADAAGNVYVADTINHSIRKVTPTGIVSTVAGSLGVPGSLNGVGTAARFQHPYGLTVDATGNLFVADYGNNVIRRVSAAGAVVTIAGSGVYGSDDGVGPSVQFFDPTGIAVDANGTLYVVDSSNNMVRKGVRSDLAFIVTQPVARRVTAGQSVTFTVAALGNGLTYRWLKNGAEIAGPTSASYTIGSVQSGDAGEYRVRITGAGGAVESESAVLTLADPGPTARLSNLSVRTPLAAGQKLIVGMVVAGGSRDILVRAAGPALAPFGLEFMLDPRIELFRETTSVQTNDDWSPTLATTFKSVGAFDFIPGSKDAALLRGMDGQHSVHATGTGAGVVLVEGYDTGTGNSPRLINVSARNVVGTGDNILIAGFAVSGSGSKRLLIRAIGPGLTQFSVPSVLADPKLEIYNSDNVKLTENDDWNASLASTFSSVSAFRLDNGSKDAALVITVETGRTYTAQVRGADGGIGEGLIEVYELP